MMTKQSARPRRSKSRGPSLTRFLVGVAMLIALVTVGPQLAAGIGGTLAEQLTKNLGTPSCSPSPDPGAQSGQVSAEPKGRMERAKARAQERRRAHESATPVSAVDECAAP